MPGKALTYPTSGITLIGQQWAVSVKNNYNDADTRGISHRAVATSYRRDNWSITPA
jgi:hypothetical protein